MCQGHRDVCHRTRRLRQAPGDLWRNARDSRPTRDRTRRTPPRGGRIGHYTERGVNGPIDDLLFPINHGLLYFTGFDVPPLCTSPARTGDDDRGPGTPKRSGFIQSDKIWVRAERKIVAFEHDPLKGRDDHAAVREGEYMIDFARPVKPV